MATNATAASSSDANFPLFIINDILMYIVSSGNLVVNSSIVILFLIQRCRRTSENRLNPAGALVINLLIADALVGAMGIYITASFKSAPRTYTQWPYGCVNRMTPRFFFRMGSHMALINVAVDRYIAVMYTLQYRDWMTMKRCLMLIGIGWFVPSAGTAYAYLANDWTPKDASSSYCYQLHFFDVFLSYIRLPFHVAALIVVIFVQCRIFFYLRSHERNESPRYLRQYSRKSGRVLFWVTTTYVICWLPYDIASSLVLLSFRPSFFAFLGSAVVLAYSSFLVNAFIFSFKTKNIRKPVGDLLSDIWNAVTDNRKVPPGDVKNTSVVKRIENRTSMQTSSSNITTSSAVSHSDISGSVSLHI